MNTMESLDALNPSQLAGLLAPAPFMVWNGEDAASILQHQLDAPLVPDLYSAPGIEHSIAGILNEQRWVDATFAKALHSPHTPRELLLALKEFAQHVQNLPESPLRGAPATVLYYAAIAACLTRHSIFISTLNPDQLRSGFTWALSQPSVEPIRELFELAIQKV